MVGSFATSTFDISALISIPGTAVWTTRFCEQQLRT